MTLTERAHRELDKLMASITEHAKRGEPKMTVQSWDELFAGLEGWSNAGGLPDILQALYVTNLPDKEVANSTGDGSEG